MKVAIAINSAHRDVYSNKLLEFAKGVEAVGDQAVVVKGVPDAEDFDTAVMYGSWKEWRGAPHHTIKKQIAQNFKKYVQLETPVIGRGVRGINHQYLRVGVNGFLWDTTEWGFEHMDPNRYLQVFKDTGYNINTKWKVDGENIVIMMQNPGDASLRGTDIFEWCYNTIKEIRTRTTRPIIVRPHPLPRKGMDALTSRLLEFENLTIVENELPDNLRPLEEDFKDAYCVVSFSSGSAVDAVLAGVPNIALDPGNMAWLVSKHSLDNIEYERYISDRKEWMQKISHCQWNVEELENGKCWKHIKQSLQIV